MNFQRRLVCPGNEELAAFMKNKWQDIAENPKGISDNLCKTIYKAYSNVCNSKVPIKSLKELSEVKGVGKWMLRQMKGFFETDSASSGSEEAPNRGKKAKGTRRYLPQKNSVAYALLITLHREMESGKQFMLKQELINAAEASGLSRVPIVPEPGKGKPGPFGSSPQSWYSGWSCMKTLITKGLVAKSSCPAKYMLTEEGKEAARECLLRSRLVCEPSAAHSHADSVLEPRNSDVSKGRVSDSASASVPSDSSKGAAFSYSSCNVPKMPIEIPPESLNKCIQMGFSREQTVRAFHEASETSNTQDIHSLWPAVLCRLKEDKIYRGSSVSNSSCNRSINTAHTGVGPFKGPESFILVEAGTIRSKSSNNRMFDTIQNEAGKSPAPAHFNPTFGPSSTSSFKCGFLSYGGKQEREPFRSQPSELATPPLGSWEKFEDAYGVVLILDDREQFTRSNKKKMIDSISTRFEVPIEVRRLPVGDAIWVARHKNNGTEFVLDFVVERKKVDDLRMSIRDNRYKDQKLRLLKCGLKKVIYIVEGDPNFSEAAESIKTACFTTEILEGFDVQRTSGLGDTLKKYGYLTLAINQFYTSLAFEHRSSKVCPPYGAFIRRCEDLEKMTVSDVFAVQLMQVPQVTEEIAIAVVEMFPTLLSLARAYSLLDGDIRAQEEMLKKQSNDMISIAASRNIFQLIWKA